MKGFISPPQSAKIIIILILLNLSFLYGYSQADSTKLSAIAAGIDSLRNKVNKEIAVDSVSEHYLSRAGFDRFFEKYLTQLKYNRESFTEGNSAALTSSDSSTTLDLTLSHKQKNWIFSLGTSLNVTDKNGTILSSSKPTAGTEINFGVSLLIPKWRKLFYDGQFTREMYRRRHDVIDSVWEVNSNLNKLRLSSLTARKDKLDRLYSHYDSLRRSLFVFSQPQIDSMTEIKSGQIKLTEDLKNLVGTNEDPEISIARIVAKTKERGIEQELVVDGVTQYRMLWATGGTAYRRDQYATFDSTKSFSDRVSDKKFDKWSFSGVLNFLWQRTDRWVHFINSRWVNSVYANVNYSIVRTNSFEPLDNLNFNTIVSNSRNDTVYQFSDNKKVKNVSAVDYVGGWQHTFGMAGTFMLGRSQNFGLNISQNLQVQAGRSPIFNAHFGTLFRFKDSKSEKSSVNFELYFAFLDMSDTRKKGPTLWNRKNLGINATVPFSMVFFK